MALKLSTDLKRYIISQGVIKQMAGTAGTGGTCTLLLYTGTQPTDADTAPTGTSGTVLGTISGIGWGGTMGATSGTVALGTSVGYVGTAGITGTAGWARMRTYGTNFTGSAGTYVIDGDVGTAATCTFVINSVSVTAGGQISLLTAPISLA